MRKLALVFILLCSFGLAACGESSVAATPTDTPAPVATNTTAPAPTATTAAPAGAATIGMSAFAFTSGSASIKVGQSVTFNDPSDGGGFHNIVTGTNGTFSAESGAPSEFTSQGITFAPGDAKTVKFTKAGTYQFTCTIHPNMHATVTVSA
jgi:plastocyanin